MIYEILRPSFVFSLVSWLVMLNIYIFRIWSGIDLTIGSLFMFYSLGSFLMLYSLTYLLGHVWEQFKGEARKRWNSDGIMAMMLVFLCNDLAHSRGANISEWIFLIGIIFLFIMSIIDKSRELSIFKLVFLTPLVAFAVVLFSNWQWEKSEEQANFCLAKAQRHKEQGDYITALDACEQGLALAPISFSADSPATTWKDTYKAIQECRASVYASMGDMEQAQAIFAQANVL